MSVEISNYLLETEIDNSELTNTLKVNNYFLETEIESGELVNNLNVSGYLLEVEVWEPPLYVDPNAPTTNTFNIYLGTIPISKVYLGNNNISEVIL